ncbi:ubiquinone biosynthesis accessory factor UbiJ [Noviherbaspirillum denitrificans]|uniref:Ubiquinone biosynthesis accessory factor UbiJ n=1 Tax=Noviherbaspirillum denitrificans TaxID=1968433 RepID=A0A254TKS7_9BURK|nr:SCP2 sterol-binding domain-containing protein [Noviherbaspirillum denitrificans]OWW22817.1 sterol-binding protein [Noviherbaspirillum denitrificans]
MISPVSAAINHLLAREPWAREKLARHAGKVALFDAGVVSLRLKATADGMVEGASPDEAQNVTIRVKLSDLPLILQNREHAFSYVQIEGDADFANTVSQLSETLRWEAEEDLAKLFGDTAAVRLASAARTAISVAKTTQQKFVENVAEYFLEENPVLVRPQMVAEFSSDVTRLRDDVERLAKRIEKLKESR